MSNVEIVEARGYFHMDKDEVPCRIKKLGDTEYEVTLTWEMVTLRVDTQTAIEALLLDQCVIFNTVTDEAAGHLKALREWSTQAVMDIHYPKGKVIPSRDLLQNLNGKALLAISEVEHWKHLVSSTSNFVWEQQQKKETANV